MRSLDFDDHGMISDGQSYASDIRPGVYWSARDGGVKEPNLGVFLSEIDCYVSRRSNALTPYNQLKNTTALL